MCDPVSMLVGAVGGMAVSKVMSPKQHAAAPAAALPDPAEERAKAEAEAAQKANARLANDNRRRREQGTLIAKGAPTFAFGDASTTDGGSSPIGSTIQPVTRSTAAKRAPLITQGAPMMPGGGGGGRSAGRYSENVL